MVFYVPGRGKQNKVDNHIIQFFSEEIVIELKLKYSLRVGGGKEGIQATLWKTQCCKFFRKPHVELKWYMSSVDRTDGGYGTEVNIKDLV